MCSSRRTSKQQKIVATAVFDTTLLAVAGTYDDVNRLCGELAADRPWAFVNVNVRPYYSEGSKTLAYEVAEQLGWTLPDRCIVPIASGSLYTKIHRGYRDLLELGLCDGTVPRLNGAQAAGCSPVATAWDEGRDFVAPVHPDTIAKSLAIGNPADGVFALEVARATGGSVDRRHRRGDRRGHPPAGRDDRHLHRDGRRRRRRPCCASSPSAARSTPMNASCSTSPATGSKTLDAVSPHVAAIQIEANVAAFEAATGADPILPSLATAVA